MASSRNNDYRQQQHLDKEVRDELESYFQDASRKSDSKELKSFEDAIRKFRGTLFGKRSDLVRKWKEMDKSDDDKINLKEFQDYLSIEDENVSKSLFEVLDLDGSGELERDEFFVFPSSSKSKQEDEIVSGEELLIVSILGYRGPKSLLPDTLFSTACEFMIRKNKKVEEKEGEEEEEEEEIPSTSPRKKYTKQTRSEMYTKPTGWTSTNYSCEIRNRRNERKTSADFNITLISNHECTTCIEGHALCSIPMNAKTGVVFENWVPLVESKRGSFHRCSLVREVIGEEDDNDENDKRKVNELRVRAFFFDPRLVWRERMRTIQMTQNLNIEKKRSQLRRTSYEASLKDLREKCEGLIERANRGVRKRWQDALRANRDLTRNLLRNRLKIDGLELKLKRNHKERLGMNEKWIGLRDEADLLKARHEEIISTMKQELRRSQEKFQRRLAREREISKQERLKNERLKEMIREQEICNDEVLRHEVARKLEKMDEVETLKQELELKSRAEFETKRRIHGMENEMKRLKGVCKWYDETLRRATRICAKRSRDVVMSRSSVSTPLNELSSPIRDAVEVDD